MGFTNPNLITSTLDGSQTITVTPAFLLLSLDAGTNVTLQASNTITIRNPITEAAASTGSLTLTAGTSIALNAAINTAKGSLTLNAPTVTTTGAIVLLAGTGTTTGAINFNAGTGVTGAGNSLTLNAPTVNIGAVGTGTRSLVLTPTAGKVSGTLTQGVNVLNVTNASNVNVSGAAGDTAFLNDQAGTNLYIGTSTYSDMSGGTGATAYFEAAFGYGTVYGTKTTASNNDTAGFFSTKTNDIFYGTPTYSYLVIGPVVTFMGGSPNSVYQFGTTAGGTHPANLFTSANAGDNYFGLSRGNLSYVLTATGQIYGGVNESSITVFASATVAQGAFLYDGAGSDALNAGPFSSILAYGNSNNFYQQVVTPRSVVFYSFNGGTDSAILNDSTGNDFFSGSSNTDSVSLGSSAGQTRTYQVIGFASRQNTISLNSTQGGNDTSSFDPNTLLYTVIKTGNWH
jgi:hypothetical protein